MAQGGSSHSPSDCLPRSQGSLVGLTLVIHALEAPLREGPGLSPGSWSLMRTTDPLSPTWSCGILGGGRLPPRKAGPPSPSGFHQDLSPPLPLPVGQRHGSQSPWDRHSPSAVSSPGSSQGTCTFQKGGGDGPDVDSGSVSRPGLGGLWAFQAWVRIASEASLAGR